MDYAEDFANRTPVLGRYSSVAICANQAILVSDRPQVPTVLSSYQEPPQPALCRMKLRRRGRKGERGVIFSPLCTRRIALLCIIEQGRQVFYAATVPPHPPPPPPAYGPERRVDQSDAARCPIQFTRVSRTSSIGVTSVKSS